MPTGSSQDPRWAPFGGVNLSGSLNVFLVKTIAPVLLCARLPHRGDHPHVVLQDPRALSTGDPQPEPRGDRLLDQGRLDASTTPFWQHAEREDADGADPPLP